MGREQREKLTIAGRGIAIEWGREMTDPCLVDPLAIEHTRERIRIWMWHVPKRIAADEGADVYHE